MSRIFENLVLRRIIQPKRKVVTGSWGDCIMKSFILCTFYELLLGDEICGETGGP
jgi:hypothetical protein